MSRSTSATSRWHGRAARVRTALASTLFVTISSPSLASAQSDDPATDVPLHLVIGTKEAAPFVIGGSEPEGISIYLLKEIARDLGFTYELKMTDLEGILRGVADGTFDAGIAAITITAEREQTLDFSHPFYATGLGIAVPAGGGSLVSIARQFFSLAFLKAVCALVFLLFLVGALMWLVERRRNPEQFGGGTGQGLASGFWWSAVTMTTVGYGDKAPTSFLGRLVGLVWMFAAIIMISGFTASFTSALTVGQLSSRVRSPDDLSSVRVGAVRGSTSERYLGGRAIAAHPYGSVTAGLAALADGDIEAMVHDKPVLEYLVRSTHRGDLRVLPFAFEPQSYGIALHQASPLREPINRALLDAVTSESWRVMLDRYLGE